MQHLAMVMEILIENQFVANSNKCQFRVSRIEYLGHIVSKEGVAADPTKIEAMGKWLVP